MSRIDFWVLFVGVLVIVPAAVILGYVMGPA